RGEVERLVERTLLRGAVAEEAQDDLALLSDLRREGDACRLGDALTDDSGRAEEPAARVEEVHRAAVAAAQTVLAAVDLGHDRLRVRPERDRIAVTAVGRHQLVAGLYRGERADDRCLGPVGQVGVTPDHAWVLLERALDPLLELADPQHLRVDPD